MAASGTTADASRTSEAESYGPRHTGTSGGSKRGANEEPTQLNGRQAVAVFTERA